MSHRTLPLRLLLYVLVFLVGALQLAGAIGLDTQGGCMAPCYTSFTCHKDVDLIQASGRPNFKINLAGHCGAQAYGGPPGWKHVVWRDVTVTATYNYDTGAAAETIWIGPDIIIDAKLQCNKNPWAHGNSCTPTQEITNNTDVYNLSNQTALFIDNWTWPASALRMSYQQRQSIARWEEAGPAPTLDDWVPYTTGTAKVIIFEPNLSNPIPKGSMNFDLKAAATVGLGPNDRLEFEWERILLPKDSSIEIGGRHVPYSTVHTPTSVPHTSFPLSVRTPSSPGLYAVRAKIAGHPDNTMTHWRMFWVGEPIPSLEQYAVEDRASKMPLTVSASDRMILFDETGPQEVSASAAMDVMGKQTRIGPAGLGATQPATSGTPVLPGPSMPGKAKQGLGPMVPGSTDAKIRRASPAQQGGKAKAAALSPQVSPEKAPLVSKEKTGLQEQQKKSAVPVTNGGAPTRRLQ